MADKMTHQELSELLLQMRNMTNRIYHGIPEVGAPELAIKYAKNMQWALRNLRICLDNWVTLNGGPSKTYWPGHESGPEKGLPR